MAANDIWRLSCVGEENTEVRVITMHIKFLTGGATMQGAAAYLKTNLLDLLKDHQPNTFKWTEIRGHELAVPSAVDAYSTGFPVTGTVSSASQVAPQTATVVSVKTQYAGRSYRGRNYLPAVAYQDMSAGKLGTTAKNAIQTYYDDLVAALGDGGSNTDYQWVVFSRKLGTTIVGGEITAYDLTKAWPVVSATVREILGTQRRRTFGVGA